MPTTHLVLLRGVNVGTRNRVPMADLRELLTGLGYSDVRTLLNSGNAVVTTETSAPSTVAAEVNAAIRQRFGLSITTIVRSREQVSRVIEHNPMPEREEEDPARFHIGFCDPPAANDALDGVDLSPLGDDIVEVDDGTLYVWFAHGVQSSKVPRVLAAARLGDSVTLRNANTVRKLLRLADTVQG